MTKTTQAALVLAIGLSLCGPRMARAQAVAPGSAGQVPRELAVFIKDLDVQVRKLADHLGVGPGEPGVGTELARDTQELSLSLTEFQTRLGRSRDRFALRRAYAGIDSSWHHLAARLGAGGVPPARVGLDLTRIDQLDMRIHEMLGLNPYPSSYYGATAAPSGLAEVQRLTHALVDRAEALAAIIRDDLPGPQGQVPYDAAMSLVRVVDAFHDGIDLNAPLNIARTGYAGVEAETKQFEQDLAPAPTSPRIREAWRSFKSVEVLLRNTLGLPLDPQDQAASALPLNGPSPVVELSNQLVQQVGAFLQVFRSTGAKVPERALFVADAARLEAAATRFRDETAQGLTPARLAFAFREVDASWQRLARRTGRIARGQTGPNIQQVERIGQTCAQLHQLLGLPGYPAVIGPIQPVP